MSDVWLAVVVVGAIFGNVATVGLIISGRISDIRHDLGKIRELLERIDP